MTIIAAADGSALGNPGPAGWAWYVDDECWAAGGWVESTNNRGELTAVLELLRATARTGEDLLVQADSQYVINSVTKWMKGWKRRGWRKADGRPVLNDDLMKEIDRELAGRDVRFEWVRGHIGHPMNEAAGPGRRPSPSSTAARCPTDRGGRVEPSSGLGDREFHVPGVVGCRIRPIAHAAVQGVDRRELIRGELKVEDIEVLRDAFRISRFGDG